MLSHCALVVAGEADVARLYLVQSRMSELFGVDIHPAARLGREILMDHATGIVVGETAVVEDDVRRYTASPWAAPARRRATGIQKSDVECCCRLEQRFLEISRWVSLRE